MPGSRAQARANTSWIDAFLVDRDPRSDEKVYFLYRVLDLLGETCHHADMHGMARNDLEQALSALGANLDARGLRFDVVLVGGANLLLRGVIERPTRDGDLLGQRLDSGDVVAMDELPPDLARAVADVALAYGLAPDWLNTGPASLVALGLPPGFASRLSCRTFGGLSIWSAGRYDMVCFKLYAAADHWPSQDRHLADLMAMRPTREELVSAARWARTHDPSPAFRSMLVGVLATLGVEDADAAID
jgi:hypothetical protein